MYWSNSNMFSGIFEFSSKYKGNIRFYQPIAPEKNKKSFFIPADNAYFWLALKIPQLFRFLQPYTIN